MYACMRTIDRQSQSHPPMRKQSKKEIKSTTHGGNSLFGILSNRTSPSLGGGISRSGGHDVMLCGVFQGTALGGDAAWSAEEAWRTAGMRRRHWYDGWRRERSSGESSRGGGIVARWGVRAQLRLRLRTGGRKSSGVGCLARGRAGSSEST